MRNRTLPKQVGGFYPVQLLVLILKKVPANAMLLCTVFLMANHLGAATGASVQNKNPQGLLSTKLEPKIEPKFQILRDLFYANEKPSDVNLQSIDIYYQGNRRLQPVMIYVHDGSWVFGGKKDINFKADIFVGQGISFILMKYSRSSDYQFYDRLEDIASVVGQNKKNGDAFSLDADSIILMGHGARKHLVSLVASDSNCLWARELNATDVRAVVVAIDTLSFDISRV